MDILNWIGDRHQPALNGRWLDNTEPATGRTYGRIPRSDAADVAAAVAAAEAAFPTWSALHVDERSACILRLADAVRRHFDELVATESRDNGKPVQVARHVDIPRAEKNLRFFATSVQHFVTESHVTAGTTHIHYVHRKPLGVVGVISPWNLPLYLFTWKLAPALAMGNCVVAKPSEVTPASAYLLSQWITEAGFPPGVFNIVHGLGGEVGEAIVQHPRIKAISFTGGTATGTHIARAVAGTQKKICLELGGKNPGILFADCDFERALQTTLQSAFANQGQICLCASRILIEDSLYDRFRDALVAKARAWKIGDPSLPETRMGAVASAAHQAKILSYIEQARQLGGTILCGGEAVVPEGERCAAGYFVAPTIIEGLDPQCAVNQEEIFGPVITLQRFRDESEALALANATEYGLACTIWTENLGRAHRMAAGVESGIAWINCWLERDLRMPFGGVKNSGSGREGGIESLRFFSEPQSVCVYVGEGPAKS